MFMKPRRRGCQRMHPAGKLDMFQAGHELNRRTVDDEVPAYVQVKKQRACTYAGPCFASLFGCGDRI